MTIALTEQQKIKILNSDDIFSIMQDILIREEKIDQEKEHFWMIGLDSSHRIQYIEMVSLGTVNTANVEPMNVFRIAVMKGSVSAVMIHNHPSGEIKASEKDKDLTDRLFQVGRILNVPILDHLIITTKSYMSFADSGLLTEISKSVKWVPAYEIEERIRSEEKKIRAEAIKAASEKSLEKGRKQGKEEGLSEGIEQGKSEYKIEIAKMMKNNNEPIEKIMKYTGLHESEIRKI